MRTGEASPPGDVPPAMGFRPSRDAQSSIKNVGGPITARTRLRLERAGRAGNSSQVAQRVGRRDQLTESAEER
jgi:hypothetical protein